MQVVRRPKRRCFLVEFAKFLKTEVYKRLLLKPAVSPGVSVLINYTCGSNWYLAQQIFVLMKTSWRRLSSSSSEDVLIKMNIFNLPNIFVLAIHLQGVFKTFSRRLQDVFQRYLQGVFKTCHQVKLFPWVTLLRNLWSVQKICKCNKNSSSFSITRWF